MRKRWDSVLVNSYTQVTPASRHFHRPTNVGNSPFNVPENPKTATVHRHTGPRFLPCQILHNIAVASGRHPISPAPPKPPGRKGSTSDDSTTTGLAISHASPPPARPRQIATNSSTTNKIYATHPKKPDLPHLTNACPSHTFRAPPSRDLFAVRTGFLTYLVRLSERRWFTSGPLLKLTLALNY